MSLLNFMYGLGGSNGIKQSNLPSSVVQKIIEDTNNGKLSIQDNKIYAYTCISIIANNFSKLKINVKKDNVIQKNHPLQYVLNYKLNSYQNKQTVFSTLETHRNETGNSLLWIESRRPYKFRILPPELIQDYEIINGELTYKILGVKDIRYKDKFPSVIKARDVLHFRQIADDGVLGLSPLVAAHSSIDMLNNATSTINNFYKNGAITQFALESTVPNNEGSAALAKKSRTNFKKTNTGVGNAGEIIKLPFGHKLTPLAVKIVDEALLKTVAFNRDAFCSMYSMPNSFLNEQDSTKDIEQDTLQFKALCMSPIASIYENEMMFKLLSKKEILDGYSIEFDLDGLVEVDTKSKVQVYKDAVRNFMMSPYEASQKLGFENNSDEAKKLRGEAQLIPLVDFDKYHPLLRNDPTAKGANDNKIKNNNNDE
ncbi:phage portal protein [Carboxylicivirga sp. RSCT41]|uniref:phage portal protein n=1 Tax=Carboxylicivirga agarovorans TaxID=3417570 RepID=UPI003D33F99F